MKDKNHWMQDRGMKSYAFVNGVQSIWLVTVPRSRIETETTWTQTPPTLRLLRKSQRTRNFRIIAIDGIRNQTFDDQMNPKNVKMLWRRAHYFYGDRPRENYLLHTNHTISSKPIKNPTSKQFLNGTHRPRPGHVLTPQNTNLWPGAQVAQQEEDKHLYIYIYIDFF